LDLGPFLFLASLEGLVQAAVLSLSALGLCLVFGVLRVVNVAHGEFYMAGAVIAWAISHALPGQPLLGFLAALFLAPLLVGLAAFIADRAILRKINHNPEATIVATIGMLYVIQQSVLIGFGPDARPMEPPFYFHVNFPWFGYSGYKLSVILMAAALLLFVWYVISRTRLGLFMRATQLDREMAQVSGIPVGWVYGLVFAAGAMLAALGAVLIAPIRQVHYLMGLDPLLMSFIVVIIGGLGSIRGALLAALVIGMCDGIISMFFSPTLAKMISTLLVALVLILRPEGLFGQRKPL